MKKKLFFIVIILALFSSAAFANDTSSLFVFEHSKGKKCADNWSYLEELISSNKVRCKDFKILKGFPYLRGNKRLLALSDKISTKYSKHKWLELLRRMDLQARYVELDLLPKTELEKFCNKAEINCFKGRIRAYIARCSAIIMGDEKINPDFFNKLLLSAKDTIKIKEGGDVSCFNNVETLDGLLNEEAYLEIFLAPKAATNANYLNKRIQSMKNMTSGKRY